MALTVLLHKICAMCVKYFGCGYSDVTHYSLPSTQLKGFTPHPAKTKRPSYCSSLHWKRSRHQAEFGGRRCLCYTPDYAVYSCVYRFASVVPVHCLVHLAPLAVRVPIALTCFPHLPEVSLAGLLRKTAVPRWFLSSCMWCCSTAFTN
jgi:hypothetical protein